MADKAKTEALPEGVTELEDGFYSVEGAPEGAKYRKADAIRVAGQLAAEQEDADEESDDGEDDKTDE